MKIHIGRSVGAVAFVLLLLVLAVTPSFADNNVVLYTNGPINGNVGGYSVSSLAPYSVADSFTLSGQATITSFTAGFWLTPADVPTTGSWAITNAPDFSGYLGGASLTGTGSFTNVSAGSTLAFGGFDLYNSTLSGLSIPLGPGTYYLELFNVSTSLSNNIFWDENDGPSTAYMNALGPIGSESFTITGQTPEPGTLLMFGTGALGLLGAVRRRFSL